MNQFLDLLVRRAEPLEIGARATVVVPAAAARGDYAQSGDEQPERGPHRDALPSFCSSLWFVDDRLLIGPSSTCASTPLQLQHLEDPSSRF